MKIQTTTALSLIATCLFTLSVANCQADNWPPDQRMRPALNNSMSYYDVLKLWGPPTEKQEFAAKREDIWTYGSARVIFREGKVAAWFSDTDNNNAIRIQPKQVYTNKPVKGNSSDDSAVEEILKDILKEPTIDSPSQAKPGKPKIIR